LNLKCSVNFLTVVPCCAIFTFIAVEDVQNEDDDDDEDDEDFERSRRDAEGK